MSWGEFVRDTKGQQVPACGCATCWPVTLCDARMVVCSECGNKRCPHANDQRNPCTGSSAEKMLAYQEGR
ncbi:hypothetical protein FHY35_001406 [Xanthomonas arboricola]|nr:hypothetical protein [Xanthomonas arboricola]